MTASIADRPIRLRFRNAFLGTVAAGALSLADACKIIVVRSEQQQRTQGAGGMAALQLPADQSRDVLQKLRSGDASWETMVPAEVAKKIRERNLFGCKGTC